MAPVVRRVFSVETYHQRIAVGFGQDGSRGDGEVGRVALDHTLIRDSQTVFEAIAVDEQEFGLDGETGHRIVHSLYGGVEDVDLVNSLFGDLCHTECQRITFDDGAQLFALGGGELFGIVNLLIHIIVWKHYGSGAYRARQAAASRLVAPTLHAGLV